MKVPMGSIEQRGPFSFRARFDYNGVPYQETFRTAEAAADWLQRRDLDIRGSRFEIAIETEKLTVGEALDRYEEKITPTKQGAKHEYSTLKVVRHFWADKLNKRLVDILARDITEYRDKRLSSPCVRFNNDGSIQEYQKKPSGSTVRKELCLISDMFTKAIVEWSCVNLMNPVTRGIRPAPNVPIERRISKAEFLALRASAIRYENGTTNSKVPIGLIIEFALVTGLRLGEIARLEWRMIDLVRRVADCGIGKNKKRRVVPLSARAIEILQALHPKLRGSVWNCDSESIRTAWNRVVTRAEIENLRFHDLRHECISTLVENAETLQLSVPEIMAISGHASYAAFLVYVNADKPRLARKLDRHFGLSAEVADCPVVLGRNSQQLATRDNDTPAAIEGPSHTKT